MRLSRALLRCEEAPPHHRSEPRANILSGAAAYLAPNLLRRRPKRRSSHNAASGDDDARQQPHLSPIRRAVRGDPRVTSTYLASHGGSVCCKRLFIREVKRRIRRVPTTELVETVD